MEVTDVRVRKVDKEGKMKAIVSITFDEEFVIHDIKVIEGEKGLFIAMPSRKTTDGEYRDIAHPIRSTTRELLQQTILEKYQEDAEEESEALWAQQKNTTLESEKIAWNKSMHLSTRENSNGIVWLAQKSY